MATDFFDSFNASLPDLEASFTENWIFNGKAYPAIAIDKSSFASKAMRGGTFEDVTGTIYIRKSVFDSSKVAEGNYVTARGQDYVILAVESEGDDCRTLILGSPQIDVWGK